MKNLFKIKYKKKTKKNPYAYVMLFPTFLGAYVIQPTLKLNEKEAINEAIDRYIAMLEELRLK